MARIGFRSLIVLSLAAAGLCDVALAQLPDPGFGDPTRLTPAAGIGLPTAGSAMNSTLPGSYVPQGPNQPGSPVRPNSWPGGAPTPVPGYPKPAAAPPEAYLTAYAAQTTTIKKSPADPPYDPAEILARIGSERIQACEVLPMVNRAIHNGIKDSKEFAALPPERREEEIHRAQREYIKAALKELVGTKLLVAELRNAADAKMISENEKKIRDHFNNDFLRHLQKEYEASSIIDLENKLRLLGGSLESQRALFVEQNLAAGWLSQSVKKEDREPTHDEMVAYYKSHNSDWHNPARVRWEQITASWSNFNSKQEALTALAQWGDDVMIRQVPFAKVAKEHSQEYAADEGGVHDWATQGSLRSSVLDTALFAVPIGAMSRIIEDSDGCHIVRVLEREDARMTPFTDVQPEIKKQLHDGGESKRRNDYIEKLREATPVWTVFDEEFTQTR